MKQKEELSEITRLVNHVLNRMHQIKAEEKRCKDAGNSKDLTKLESKQMQLTRILNVLETLNEG